MNRFWLHLFFVLAWLSFWEPAEARRARFRPTPPKPKKSETEKAIEKLAPGQNINIDQMSGKWYLLSVASRCKNLLETGFKVESTTVTWTVTGDKVFTSTVTKLNFACWEIKQNYMKTKTPGQLFLKGKRPIENMDIMVLETDYSSYAMLVLKRAGKITMKLYGRSSEVPDKILDKFEDRAKTFSLGLDVIFPYPGYGFCESTEKVLEREPYTSTAMTTVALKMLCVLLCAVFASAEVMPMTDFDLEKMGGKWYLVGFATNAKWFVSHKDDMKMGSAMLMPTAEGDLDLSYTNLKSDGSCWRMTHLAKKTETPGRFVFHSQRWENDNDMRVVDAKYDEYALVHTIKTKGDVSEVLNKLYSRTPEVTDDLKEKFRQFSLDTGILEENIAMLPPNGECSVA